MFERSFTLSFENKVSKKVTFIFPLIFLIKFQSHETFRKFMKVFLCEIFSIGRSNQKIPKKKFKQTHFFEKKKCFLRFFHFFNERVLVVPQKSYNVLHLIYWCRNFSIHKNFKALIVWRNRFNLRPQTLSSSSNFPDKSGESQSRETTGILLFP